MPTAKLSKRTIDAAQPQLTEYEIRDVSLAGFLCRVTPNGRKTFMFQYRTTDGRRRKPAIGTYGEVTVDQARAIAQKWMAEVRAGGDPLFDKQQRREVLTLKQLFNDFMERHVAKRCRPRTYDTYGRCVRKHILPTLGHVKINSITKEAMVETIADFATQPALGNVIMTCLKKMFNFAEYWGFLEKGKNPCRGIKRYPIKDPTRLLMDDEVSRIFRYLDRAEKYDLEYKNCLLATRLQFAFSARIREILTLEWEWIDFGSRRVVWPDTKTGRLWKPISSEAMQLLKSEKAKSNSRYVLPAIEDNDKHLPYPTYWNAWRRTLEASRVSHVGTHAVRHRAATDIANSGVPIKVGMALTGHRDLQVFMKYVHIIDAQVHDAINLVESKRRSAIDPNSPKT